MEGGNLLVQKLAQTCGSCLDSAGTEDAAFLRKAEVPQAVDHVEGRDHREIGSRV